MTAPPGDVGRIWPGKVGFIPLWATSSGTMSVDSDSGEDAGGERAGFAAAAGGLGERARALAMIGRRRGSRRGQAHRGLAAQGPRWVLAWPRHWLDQPGLSARRSPATVTVVDR